VTNAGGLDTLIRGGIAVGPDGPFRADIGVREGTITQIGSDLGSADEVIDATGCLVLPGAIDVHTHFETEVAGSRTADTFESGSRAAAAGGVTTFVNFAIQEAGDLLWPTVEREMEKAGSSCHVDYGFHVGVTDATDAALAQIPSLADAGFTSFKMFTTLGETALSDRESLALLSAVGRADCLVMVHAEDGALIDDRTAVLLGDGKRSVRYLNTARPTSAEALATGRIAAYAGVVGCPVYIVHLSCKAALDAVRQARSDGVEVYVETRPAYLFMDSSVYDRDDGPKFVTWPPIRGVEDQQALWHALALGEVHCYATDHTTWTIAQKLDPSRTFADVPGGVSNIQTSVPMLYNEGVAKGRIGLTDFVAVTSTNPAKLFGLWPKKGGIHVGGDADLYVLAEGRRFVVHADHMESLSDFDPYEGYVADAWPVLTMSRGEVLVRDGKVGSIPGRGQLVKRKRLGALRGSRPGL
jgi:dihydropyrimidinase